MWALCFVFVLIAIVIVYLQQREPQANELAFCGTVSDTSYMNAVANIKDNNGSTADGKALYQANCASCHALKKNLTGPALLGFGERFPMHLLALHLKNPKQARKKSAYLRALYQQYNNMDCMRFPDLSENELKAITAYLGVRYTGSNTKTNSTADQ